MTQIKDLYANYGQLTRALDFGVKEYKIPSKVSRKVEILVGVMMSSASKGAQVPLAKFLGRVASRWNGKGTFGTDDMFAPADVSQALRLFYAKTALGELSFKDGLLMAEVIENKSSRQLNLVFREFVPNLIQILPVDPVAPKTSKQADKTLSAILEKADLPEPVPVKTTVPEIALEPKIGEPVELSDAEKAMLQLQTMFMQSADVEVSNILGEAMEKLQALIIAKANVA